MVWYINTLKKASSAAKTFESNSLEERYVIGMHRCHIAVK